MHTHKAPMLCNIPLSSSLPSIAQVINGLVTGNLHIPYRDSTLTWILKENLGSHLCPYPFGHSIALRSTWCHTQTQEYPEPLVS